MRFTRRDRKSRHSVKKLQSFVPYRGKIHYFHPMGEIIFGQVLWRAHISAVVHHLEKRVEDVRVRLLDFVQ
jgi:hypothetical protein